MIEGVEKLCAQLHVAAFTQQMKRRPLNDRDIRVILPRAKHDADATIAKRGRLPVVANYRPDGGAGSIT